MQGRLIQYVYLDHMRELDLFHKNVDPIKGSVTIRDHSNGEQECRSGESVSLPLVWRINGYSTLLLVHSIKTLILALCAPRYANQLKLLLTLLKGAFPQYSKLDRPRKLPRSFLWELFKCKELQNTIQFQLYTILCRNSNAQILVLDVRVHCSKEHFFLRV